jgi:hypothetical protein
VADGDRWLVVGLGNPEAEYGGTRHNVGADVVRRLAERLGASFKPHKAQAQVADTFDRPGGTPLSLVVPFGYMNRSGGPVQQAMAFYSLDHDRLVVVHDDLDLDLGAAAQARRRRRRAQRAEGHPQAHRQRGLPTGCASASAARPGARTPPTTCSSASRRRARGDRRDRRARLRRDPRPRRRRPRAAQNRHH